MAEYIEREALNKWLHETMSAQTTTVGMAYVRDFWNKVMDAPAADVAPVVHGRWEEKFFTNDRQRVCSVCHCTVRQPSYDKGETALFKYCPHCGARMDGDRNG